MIPYTYRVKWTSINKSYYGVRYSENCHPDELWKTYFTSSKEIPKYRELYGEPDIIEIRKIFSNPKEAVVWESKVLKKLSVQSNSNWINIQENGPLIMLKSPMKGRIHSAEVRLKISLATKGRTAHNKGKSNPKQSERFKRNNPMKNPEIAQKVATQLKGQAAHNKIEATFIMKCETCSREHILRDTVKLRRKRFCGKSCAATHSNINRTGISYLTPTGSRTC